MEVGHHLPRWWGGGSNVGQSCSWLVQVALSPPLPSTWMFLFIFAFSIRYTLYPFTLRARRQCQLQGNQPQIWQSFSFQSVLLILNSCNDLDSFSFRSIALYPEILYIFEFCFKFYCIFLVTLQWIVMFHYLLLTIL